jgi:AcrR family transcriptional regulator
VTDVAAPLGAGVSGAGDRHGDILDVALRLMAERGVHAMSMRALAGECGVNVATIYHYFPSKQALLAEVVAHQSYDEQLAELPPVDPHGTAQARLSGLLGWILAKMDEHTEMWTLLLGESLRGGSEAIESAAELSDRFDQGLVRWLTLVVPELSDDVEVSARVVRAALFGTFVETLPMDGASRRDYAAQRAEEMAFVFFAPRG